MNDASHNPTGPHPSGRARTWRAVAGIVLVATVGAAFWWWSHPRFFDDFNGSYESNPRPVGAAQLAMAATFPATGDEATGEVRLDHARVHFAHNSAAATATFSVCHLSPGEDPIGAVHDARGSCADLEPLRSGMTITKASGEQADLGDYVVLTVTPRQPGQVRVDRVDLDYALGSDHLWRRGTESLGMDVMITAR